MRLSAVGAAVVVFVTTACGKTPAGSVPSPSCAARADELRTWLAVLAREGEIRPLSVPAEPAEGDAFAFRRASLPDFPLARIDAPPSAIPDAAVATLHDGAVTFGTTSERIADTKRVAEVFRRMSVSNLSFFFGTFSLGSGYVSFPFVLVVEADQRWGDVTAAVDAAWHHGFRQVFFTFGVPSELTQPKDGPAIRRMIAIETDPDERWSDRNGAALRGLARASAECTSVAAPFATPANSNVEHDAQRDAFAAGAANAVLACGCKVDLDAVKAFAWTRYGRHWGPATASYLVPLGQYARGDDADDAKPLAAPAAARWRDTYPLVLEASRRGLPVTFVGTP